MSFGPSRLGSRSLALGAERPSRPVLPAHRPVASARASASDDVATLRERARDAHPLYGKAQIARAYDAEHRGDAAEAARAFHVLANFPDRVLEKLRPRAAPLPAEHLATAVRALHTHVRRNEERTATTRRAAMLESARLLPTLPPEATTAAYRLLLDGLGERHRVRFGTSEEYRDVRAAPAANLRRLAHEPPAVRDAIAAAVRALPAPAPCRNASPR